MAEIVQVGLPAGQAGDVLVRARYSGISRGTEALVFNGRVPPSQYAAMRAPFQQGDYPGPVTCGYSSVGEVEETRRRRARRARRPNRVLPPSAPGPVPRAGLTAVTPVPDGVPAARAVLAANMETAVTITWDARPGPGDRIVVIGAGVVGLLAAWLCRQAPAAEVTVVDVNPAREAAAGALGLAFAGEPPPGADADIVIHASGQPDGLRAALESAGVEGTIVEASWYGTRAVPLPLGEAFHARRLTIRSSQVGRIPPARAPRWSHARRLRLALELLRDDALDALITGESRFAELPAVLARLSRGPGAALCHRISYPAE